MSIYKLKLPTLVIPSHVRTCYFDLSASEDEFVQPVKFKLCIPDMCLNVVSYEDSAARVCYYPVKDGKSYRSPFPNTYCDDGELCLGDCIFGIVQDHRIVLDKIYNSVWRLGVLSSWRSYCDGWYDYERFLCEWQRNGFVKLVKTRG